ncbi:MAG: DUF1573 domain-containing protein [Flavobacteriales bacterium]|nr:DUF1573 domain-containing protein [Flavobacteriales bacterium]
MKNRTILFVLGLIVTAMIGCTKSNSDITENNKTASNPNAQNAEAQFEWVETHHDFGNITQGSKVNWKYRFKNVGNKELVIGNVQVSCGCTATEYSKEPIAPGESGFVTLEFNSENKSGSQHKTVTVVANTNPPRTELSFSAEVSE